MLLSFVLSYLRSRNRFTWSPALDMRDHAVYSALIPGTQY